MYFCLSWWLKDFTAVLGFALLMVKVQTGDRFLGLAIFVRPLFCLGIASSTRLLLCSIMSLSSSSSFLWTWLGICLGSWILPSSPVKFKQLLSSCTPPPLPPGAICLSKCTAAVAVTLACLVLFHEFAESGGPGMIAQCKRSDGNLIWLQRAVVHFILTNF